MPEQSQGGRPPLLSAPYDMERLKRCIARLPQGDRRFLTDILNNPDAVDLVVEDHRTGIAERYRKILDKIMHELNDQIAQE